MGPARAQAASAAPGQGSVLLPPEDETAVDQGEDEEQQPLGPGQGGDGEDSGGDWNGKDWRPLRGGPLAQVEDHPGEREEDEERDLHSGERRPDEPRGGEREAGGETRETPAETELARQPPGRGHARQVEGHAEQLGPDDDAPGHVEEQGQESRPQRCRRAGHQLAGVVGEAPALRQIAGELQVDPAVVQRKPEIAGEQPGLDGEVAEAGEQRGGQQPDRGPGSGRILVRGRHWPIIMPH
jgi:hypothetical protein